VSGVGCHASRITHHASRASSKYWFGTTFSLLIFLFLTACANNASAEPTPPTIHYGEDVCEFCNMIISDERYAAGYITEDGQQHIFDDIGNMFRNHLQKSDKVTAFFVHNYENKSWIRAEKAAYVQSSQLTTPMLSGLAALESPEKAQVLAAELQGHVMTFAEVLAYYQANPMPQGEHSMEHDH
jgi:copper chaperone NosL